MPNFKDLTGQEFGEITVLGKDDELTKEKRKTYWRCRCSCGREKSIRGDNLKKIQTCGECTKDLKGKRFGRLLVEKKGKKDAAGHQFWFCKCDCGNIVEINSDNLRRGLTKSCGCYHAEQTHKARFRNLAGSKYGKLTVEDNYKIENDITYWLCKCECGNKLWVRAYSLISNNTQSCGCINYSIGEKNISEILKKNKINFKKEYIFPDLPKRRYDFYLTDMNRIIEFDGEQHFKFKNNWAQTEEEFLQAQQRDKEKNQYCFKHNIPIVRIPYTERDKITLDLILGDKYLLAPNFQEVSNN
jgi:hypothetical protein